MTQALGLSGHEVSRKSRSLLQKRLETCWMTSGLPIKTLNFYRQVEIRDQPSRRRAFMGFYILSTSIIRDLPADGR